MKDINRPNRLKTLPGLVLAVLALLAAGRLASAAQQDAQSCPGQARLISATTDYDVESEMIGEVKAAGALKVVRKFDFADNVLPAGVGHMRHNIEDIRVEDGFLSFRSTGNDPWFTLPEVDIEAEEVDVIAVRAAFQGLDAVRTERFEMLFQPASASNYIGALSADVQSDGKLRTFYLFTRAGRVKGWEGKIMKLRVDPSVSSKQEGAIQSITLLKVQEDFAWHDVKGLSQGVARTWTGPTLQNVVFSSSSWSVGWTLQVPCQAELHTQVALPGFSRLMRWTSFEAIVEVKDEAGRLSTVARVHIRPSESEQIFDGVPLKADLGRWAGQRVTVQLRVSGSEGGPTPPGFIYWVNPYVTSARSAASNRPNVILISIDTLRADHLSLYGYKRRTSPHLDEWSERGVVYENAFSHSPWTLPSHASMFTSLYPSQHLAVFSFREGEHYFSHGSLADSFVTIAEKMQEAGYVTAAFSGGGFLSWFYNVHQGYDYWYQPFEFGRDLALVSSWLGSNRSARFFLFLHTYEVHEYVHHGMRPELLRRADAFNPGYAGKVKDQAFNIDSHYDRGAYNKTRGLDRKDVKYLEALYDGTISIIDEGLNKLFVELSRLGLDEDTMVIVTSDHGEEFDEHGGLKHGHSLYDEMIRVPLVVRYPKGLARRGRAAEVVGLVDLYPTILDVAGLEAPQGLEGRSLLEIAGGPEDGPGRPVFAERPGMLLSGVRTGGGKLIYRAGDRLTFDLGRDPLERHPRPASAETGELEALHDRFLAKNGGYHLLLSDPRLSGCPIRLTTGGRFMNAIPRLTEQEDLIELKEDKKEILLKLDLKDGDTDGLYFLVLPETVPVRVELCEGDGKGLDGLAVSFGANGPRPVGPAWTVGEYVGWEEVRVQSSPFDPNGGLGAGVALWKLESRRRPGGPALKPSDEQKGELVRRLRSLGYVQ